jgi:hypothetical protein
MTHGLPRRASGRQHIDARMRAEALILVRQQEAQEPRIDLRNIGR